MRTTVGPALKKVFGFTPLFSGPIYGVGFLTAGMVLAIMTVPFIISVSREVLLAVPREQREAALALGATRWESTWQVVVPYARLGILGSIFLGLARALGETMAVTMVIGNDPQISASLFAPGYSIAAVIANEFSEATGDFISALIELGLVLFLLTIVINGLARLMIVATTQKGTPRHDDPRIVWRKSVNAVMLSADRRLHLAGASASCFSSWDTWSITAASSLNLEFLHQAAACRSAKSAAAWPTRSSAAWKSLCWRPSSASRSAFSRASTWPSSTTRRFAFVVRYVADLLNGIPPSWSAFLPGPWWWLPMKHFSALAGGVALGVMLIPITARSTEQFLREVPLSLREGGLALGASKWKTIATVVVPAGSKGILTGMIWASPHRRRIRSAAVHRLQQSVLGRRAHPAHGFAAGDDLQLRHFARTTTGIARPGRPAWF